MDRNGSATGSHWPPVWTAAARPEGADLRRRRSPPSCPAGTRGQLECVPHCLTSPRFHFSPCSHNTNSLSWNISSFFKEKTSQPPSSQHGGQWRAGLPGRVKGALCGRPPPPPAPSSGFLGVCRGLSLGCFHRACRLPADGKQPSSCARPPCLPSRPQGRERVFVAPLQ